MARIRRTKAVKKEPDEIPIRNVPVTPGTFGVILLTGQSYSCCGFKFSRGQVVRLPIRFKRKFLTKGQFRLIP